MKYLYPLILMALSSIFLPVNAQRKDILLNFGIQKNIPERFFYKRPGSYRDKNSGLGVYLYPKWQYSPKLSFGVNVEYSLVTEDASTDAIGYHNIFSFSPTANYYFLNERVRPFVGAGVGLYHLAYQYPTIHLGARPIIGVSFDNYIDFSLEYNRIFGNLHINPHRVGEIHNYYVALKASFSIGIANIKRKQFTHR